MTAASLLVRPPADSARQPRTSIVQVERLRSTGSCEGPWERLERHKPKGLRVVLRGLGSSNAPRLPGGGGGNAASLPDHPRPVNAYDFPQLTQRNHRITSEASPDYNCIAWSSGATDRWWQPGRYWPTESPPGDY